MLNRALTKAAPLLHEPYSSSARRELVRIIGREIGPRRNGSVSNIALPRARASRRHRQNAQAEMPAYSAEMKFARQILKARSVACDISPAGMKSHSNHREAHHASAPAEADQAISGKYLFATLGALAERAEAKADSNDCGDMAGGKCHPRKCWSRRILRPPKLKSALGIAAIATSWLSAASS